MAKLAQGALIVGIISLLVGIISRLTMAPLPVAGIEAQALLSFSQTCILLAIAAALIKK